MRKTADTRSAAASALCVTLFLTVAQTASASFIGWQTFSPCTAGNNNSGVCDTTPESNSTFDASPTGSISVDDTYLTGAIGVAASAAGRKGRGQQANNTFLNGAGFGNETANPSRLIVNIPLADGSPGVRIGPNGSTPQGAPNGTSSWKFSTNDNARTGDFRVTNESDYPFRIQFIHLDVRVGNANSPQQLEIKYLSGDGTAFDNALTRFDTGTELTNLNNIYLRDFGPGPAFFNISHSLGGAIGTQAYLAAGQSAGFRVVWTDFLTNGAESQIDNLAIEGQFFQTSALQVEIDPADISPQAATYYVSASSGDDTNDGLSEATALQTLGRVNALALLPGDEVLFKSGDLWQGMLWPKGSGTAAQPIRIGAYGIGAKPVIDGDGYQASLLLFNDDHYELQSLELTNQASHLDTNSQPKAEVGFSGAENEEGTGADVRYGLKVVASTRSLSGYRIANLDIHDIYPSPSNAANAHKGYGIKFESQSDLGAGTIYTVSNVEMDGLDIQRTGHYGAWIRPLGLSGVDEHKHQHFTLRNSTFLNTGGAGFVAVKAQHVLVEYNTFDGTGSSVDSRMWKRGSGLWPFDSKDVLIQHNVMRHARGPLDSYGVHIDYNNEDVLVQYNYSYDNEGGFAQILGANLSCGYRYNISVGDGSRVEGVNGALQNGRLFNVSDFCNVNAGCASAGNFLYNNTVFVPSGIQPEIVFQAGSGETLFQNNLIAAQSGGDPVQTEVASAGVIDDIDSNLFYPAERFDLAPALTNGAYTFDPQLRMPGADDPAMYKLLPDSPAKASGTFIAETQDFFGFAVPTSASPHVGAYNGDETFAEPAAPAMNPAWRILAVAALSLVAVRTQRRRAKFTARRGDAHRERSTEPRGPSPRG